MNSEDILLSLVMVVPLNEYYFKGIYATIKNRHM